MPQHAVVTETLHQIRHEHHDAFKRDIVFPNVASHVHHALLDRPGAILDIGTGSGELSSHLNPKVITRAHLVDVNKDILSHAATQYEANGFATETFHHSATTLLNIKPGSIRVAVAAFSLNQVEHPEVAFHLAHRYLTPHGKLIVVVPDEAYTVAINAEKISPGVRGVLEQKPRSFRFREQGFDVMLHSRPNDLYRAWMQDAGFIVSGIARLPDPTDKFAYTPKATIFMGKKSPSYAERDGFSYRMKRSIRTVRLQDVVFDENIGFLIGENVGDGRGETIPIPRNQVEKVIDLCNTQPDQILLVSLMRLRMTGGREMFDYWVFHNDEIFLRYEVQELPNEVLSRMERHGYLGSDS